MFSFSVFAQFNSGGVIWLFWIITFEVCCVMRHFPCILLRVLMFLLKFFYPFVLGALSYLFTETNATSLQLFPGMLGFTGPEIPRHDASPHPSTLTAAAIKHNVTTQKRRVREDMSS